MTEVFCRAMGIFMQSFPPCKLVLTSLFGHKNCKVFEIFASHTALRVFELRTSYKELSLLLGSLVIL